MAKYDGPQRKQKVTDKNGNRVTRKVGSDLSASVTSNSKARDAFYPRPTKEEPVGTPVTERSQYLADLIEDYDYHRAASAKGSQSAHNQRMKAAKLIEAEAESLVREGKLSADEVAELGAFVPGPSGRAHPLSAHVNLTPARLIAEGVSTDFVEATRSWRDVGACRAALEQGVPADYIASLNRGLSSPVQVMEAYASDIPADYYVALATSKTPRVTWGAEEFYMERRDPTDAHRVTMRAHSAGIEQGYYLTLLNAGRTDAEIHELHRDGVALEFALEL